MDDNETLTNPETEVTETASTEALPEELATDEIQDGDENGEEGQNEIEEIEFNGKKYSVPKELAPNLMMQSDYTRKTQEVAELRKDTEAERTSWQQKALVRDQLFQENADLHQVEKRLNAFRNVNWQQWQAQDANGAQAALAEYT